MGCCAEVDVEAGARGRWALRGVLRVVMGRGEVGVGVVVSGGEEEEDGVEAQLPC